MSKTPLSHLSILMPVKGEAAQKEDLPESSRIKPSRLEMSKETRDNLSHRVIRDHGLRLSEMAHKEGRTKQSLLDEAIIEYLTRRKY